MAVPRKDASHETHESELAKDKQSFLESYAGHSALYRLVRFRFAVSPIFLRRNLSYVTDFSPRRRRTQGPTLESWASGKLQAAGSDDQPHQFRLRLEVIACVDEGQTLRGDATQVSSPTRGAKKRKRGQQTSPYVNVSTAVCERDADLEQAPNLSYTLTEDRVFAVPLVASASEAVSADSQVANSRPPFSTVFSPLRRSGRNAFLMLHASPADLPAAPGPEQRTHSAQASNPPRERKRATRTVARDGSSQADASSGTPSRRRRGKQAAEPKPAGEAKPPADAKSAAEAAKPAVEDGRPTKRRRVGDGKAAAGAAGETDGDDAAPLVLGGGMALFCAGSGTMQRPGQYALMLHPRLPRSAEQFIGAGGGTVANAIEQSGTSSAGKGKVPYLLFALSWEPVLDAHSSAPPLALPPTPTPKRPAPPPVPAKDRDDQRADTDRKTAATAPAPAPGASMEVEAEGGGGTSSVAADAKAVAVPVGGSWLYEPPVYYDFLYWDGQRKQTEIRYDMKCPWCLDSFTHFPSLYQHLVFFHDRFGFQFEEDITGRPHINVSVHDGGLERQAGPAPPQAQTVVDWPAKRRKRAAGTSAEAEFHAWMGEAEDGLEDKIKTIGVATHPHAVMKRTYYRCADYAAIRPEEMDYDSADNCNSEWIRKKDEELLDEFEDVTESEKMFMKMWNVHTRAYKIRGDLHVPGACEAFVRSEGTRLLAAGLRNNFVLHLTNLWDFALVDSALVERCLRMLDEIATPVPTPAPAAASASQPAPAPAAAAVTSRTGRGRGAR